MRRILAVVLFLSAGAAIAFAQHRGGVRGGSLPHRTYGSPSGFGNILFPGTGTAPGVHMPPGNITDPSFAGRLGATVRGRPYYQGQTGGGLYGRRSRTTVVPYAVPVMVGGYGYYPGPQEPNLTIVQSPPPAAPAAPQVVINQYYASDTAQPVMREYPEGSLPEARSGKPSIYRAPGPPVVEESETAEQTKTAPRSADKATIYLIAFKDHSVYPALAYWVEGDTVHYISMQHTHNQASLDLIDRELSSQLNSERNVEFRLPAATP